MTDMAWVAMFIVASGIGIFIVSYTYAAHHMNKPKGGKPQRKHKGKVVSAYNNYARNLQGDPNYLKGVEARRRFNAAVRGFFNNLLGRAEK